MRCTPGSVIHQHTPHRLVQLLCRGSSGKSTQTGPSTPQSEHDGLSMRSGRTSYVWLVHHVMHELASNVVRKGRRGSAGGKVSAGEFAGCLYCCAASSQV